ncbi:MAG: sulfatase-like hydrolase/transferase [Acidobacteria bacterium]|nr:sulfatase-like hydrolase/transferase [Acidobacteriota bacterium]
MRAGLLALGLGAVAAGSTVAMPHSESARPNVLLIYADDLGYGDLGAYGHPIVQTPRIDELAAQGLRLTSYYAPSPLCSPSRASLLTGRTHYRTGIESWIPPETETQLPLAEITLPELLRDAGYATAMSGKWHLNGGMDQPDHAQPDQHGFDHWLGFHAWAVPHSRDPVNFFRNGEALGRLEGYAGQIVVDEAIGWLSDRPAEQPFFLYVPLFEPHSTIANPPEFNELYAAHTLGTPEQFANGLPEPPDNLEARGPGEYWANITYMDHQVGRLLDALDATGSADNTLVVFTSDNGPVTTDWRRWWEINLYGDTGGFRGRKHELYEGGIRVPAILRWPGTIGPGTASDAPIIGYDLMPTIAAATGVSMPDDRPIDGEDFGPLLRGDAWRRTAPLYWQFDDEQGFHYALRDGNWKLLADRDLERIELYDLARNRFEVFDLAGAHPARASRMLDMLRDRANEVTTDPILATH